VVTCRDSGGPAELVEENVTGFIADPTPQSLASALARVMNDEGNARWMGEAAFAAGAQLDWGDVVRRLTE
jgi:glycosyltransferase involved in cell wall biosynthesis